MRPNHKNCYRYEVYNRNDLRNIIIPFFKKHSPQFPSKREDFTIFCALVEMVIEGEHLTEKGLRKMWRMKQKMH
jgi:hypothetical protein